MGRLHRRVPLIVLSGGVIALLHRLFVGRVLYWGTPLLQFYPWRELAFGALRGGRLPLWNPLLGNGAPLLANYQTAALYPPNWLYLIVPTEYAMGWVAALHLVWAGLGMMVYLRRLGVDLLGQGVGALAFALSGYLVGRLGFLSITSAVSWLPWLFWALDGLLLPGAGCCPVRRAVVLLAGVVGMQLLAGHAQTTFYSLALAGVYTLWRASTGEGAFSPQALRRAALALGAVVLGFALAALQLAPTFELTRTSQRAAGVEPGFAFAHSFWPWHFLTLVAPNAFGSPAGGDYWGYGAYWEDAVYVGLLTLVMAAHGVARRIRERRAADGSTAARVVPFFLFSLPPVFVLALGGNTPVFPWLFEHVPTFDLFQGPARWTILAVFGLSVLGAVGADRWQTSERGLYWTRLATAGGVACTVTALVAARGLGDAINPTFIRAGVRLGGTIILLGLLTLLLPQVERRPHWRPGWEALVLALLAADLAVAHRGLAPTIEASYYHQGSRLADAIAPYVRGYRTLYLPEDDHNARYEVFLSAAGFQPDDRAHWDALRDSLLPNLGVLDGVPAANNFDPLRVGHHDALLNTLDGSLPAIQQMNVGVLLTPRPRSDLDLLAHSGPTYAYRVPDPWPRAALARCTAQSDNLVCERSADGSASLLWDEAHSVGVSVEAERAAALVLVDTFYPGWRATLDGEPVAIRRANGAFRAVDVPEGQHVVVFRYRPASVWVGAVISGVALAAMGWLWWGRSSEAGEVLSNGRA